MLDNLQRDTWERRRQEAGKLCHAVSIKTVPAGTVLKAQTKRSNYVLEVVDPNDRVVRFARLKPGANISGRCFSMCRLYNAEIRLGGTLRFGEIGNPTSVIEHLSILECASQPSPS